MKKIKFIFMLLLASVTIASCSRVEPNNKGVLMESFGKNGKSDFTLTSGLVWTFMPGTKLFQVPLFDQRAEFENHADLKASDNTMFKSRPLYSYRVIEDRAVDVVFANKQISSGGDRFMKSLEDNILEPRINDIMSEISRSYTTDTLMANGGSLKFERIVEGRVKAEFEKRGLELLSFRSQLEFSKKVTEKIDSRNEVNTNLTVLEQQITEQHKKNELERLITEQAKIRSAGLTPQILEEKWINKWNGVLPTTVAGNNAPFMINKSLR